MRADYLLITNLTSISPKGVGPDQTHELFGLGKIVVDLGIMEDLIRS